MAGEAILTDGHLNDNPSNPGTEKSSSSSKGTESGIKVIIVGAGFGGLCAAIECHRQGHDVEIFESFSELKGSYFE